MPAFERDPSRLDARWCLVRRIDSPVAHETPNLHILCWDKPWCLPQKNHAVSIYALEREKLQGYTRFHLRNVVCLLSIR